MSVVTTFEEKKREKQLKSERTLLRELSIRELKMSVLLHFGAVRICISPWLDESLEEACIDVAIEAFLTGGEMSRFAVQGENAELAKDRCKDEMNHYIETLYHFWLYWDFGQETLREESILNASEKFVAYWWDDGFKKGARRYKLRLNSF
jgi:hypothetical protein